jgi:hypothetical protein
MYNGEILIFKESLQEAFLELSVLNPEKIKDQIANMIILIDVCAINIDSSTELLSIEMAKIFKAAYNEINLRYSSTNRNATLDDLENVLNNHLGPILPLLQSKVLDNISNLASSGIKWDFFKDDFNNLRVSLKGIQETIKAFYREFDL